LLGVEFDDVAWAVDDQTLQVPNGDVVSVRVKRGKVVVRLTQARRRTRAA
jgi:formylmethanofuran dehydrogenase subunit D